MSEREDKDRYVRIEGRQAELGMYVHALHCSWLMNPFWRKSFLLIDPADREKIRRDVAHITIDLAKGRGLTLVAKPDVLESGEPPIPQPRSAPEPEPHAAVVTSIRPRRRKPPTELELASATAAKATAAVTRLFAEARLGRVIRTADLVSMVEDIAQATHKGTGAMIAVTRLKDTDQYTYIHSVAVGTLMMGLARQLGMSDEDVHVAGMAGLLHDIGKMQIAPEIVDKPGRLDAGELAQMRLHPGLGHRILLDIDDLDPRILDVCRHHHEKMDGTGYPDGLKGEEVSLFARLSAVCDVYDAVTSIRSYKRAWSPHEALAQMIEWEGHFDPEILRAFIASLDIQPFGALVRLNSNRLGIVVREGESPTTPIVRAFFDVPDQQMTAIEDVATSHDAIIRVERGEYWFGVRWAMLQAEIMAQAAVPEIPVRRRAGRM
ncbi:HD-GYP domain-containing protein [Sphingomonas sp.]|uniref:HD-GYP domain-containing protein n=1 Tax=Sphingomonas sp. TaxID=28214 RepID=UPI0031DAAA03